MCMCVNLISFSSNILAEGERKKVEERETDRQTVRQRERERERET